MGDVRERIYAAVKRIPRGRVSNYGAIAEVAGLPRRARLVGTVLRTAPPSSRLPWHRVVNAQGRVVFPVGTPAFEKQCERLEREGVVCRRGRVDLSRLGWPDRQTRIDELLWGVPGRAR
jgi:methylated-DNA-protein-cysteine methyltransferase-like protein